ncbi:hypothetical protein CVT24_000227 [Panaeolus cyanescens]|uniref:Uncharacterized protein n=1 Tax=Panaeolus cyanescens TaxID=181874 RepID=A0A409VIQ8_9AGAR|nr:hypothetical protein CVT24_000227 [Panaeolus cyanescens]
MASAQQSQTSLPSIRQLHPYLPMPTSMPTTESSSYGYSSGVPGHYQGHLAPVELGSGSMHHGMGAPSQRDIGGFYGAVESEPDEQDQHNPPKKKRRRQALSCTGYSRVRHVRAEEKRQGANGISSNQCKEKYATKAEFDELKARFDQLAALVQRLIPQVSAGGPPTHGSIAASSSYYPILSSGTLTGAAGTDFVAPTYGSNPSSGMVAYPPPMMPPPPSSQLYSPHLESAGPQPTPPGAVLPSNRFLKPDETHSPTRHAHPLAGGASSATSPLLSTSLNIGQLGTSGGGSMSRHRGSIAESSAGGGPVNSTAVSGGPTTSSSTNPSGTTPQTRFLFWRPFAFAASDAFWVGSASRGSSVTFATFTPRTASKKLVRADAHSGRASAPRIRRPSDHNPGGDTGGDMYMESGGSGAADGLGAVGGSGGQPSSGPTGGSSSSFHLPPARRVSDMMGGGHGGAGRDDRMGDRVHSMSSHHDGALSRARRGTVEINQ